MDSKLISQVIINILNNAIKYTQKVWGSAWDNHIASLRVFMATLRKKLEDGGNVSYIQTHVGIGYRMLKVDMSIK